MELLLAENGDPTKKEKRSFSKFDTLEIVDDTM